MIFYDRDSGEYTIINGIDDKEDDRIAASLEERGIVNYDMLTAEEYALTDHCIAVEAERANSAWYETEFAKVAEEIEENEDLAAGQASDEIESTLKSKRAYRHALRTWKNNGYAGDRPS